MVDVPSLRIAFFGTPGFAVPTLQALLRSRHAIVGVVSQPDRPRGRGGHTPPTPVKVAAGTVAVLQPERLKEPSFRDALAAMQLDLGVVAAYGKILPDWLLALPRLGMINVHASLLPRYRGAAPIHRALMAGEPEIGVTIMRIVKELDAGPMLARTAIPVASDATTGDVERTLASVGADLLVETVDAIADGRATEEPQDDSQATYAPKIAPEDSRIDWTRSAWDIHNQVRGLNPSPMAWTRAGEARVLIVRTVAEDEAAAAGPGEVVESRRGVLRVATARGTLRILELKPEGRRAMSARDFLAGHPLPPGARLT
jgi:methionyl-tRNA formyltransferase